MLSRRKLKLQSSVFADVNVTNDSLLIAVTGIQKI